MLTGMSIVSSPISTRTAPAASPDAPTWRRCRKASASVWSPRTPEDGRHPAGTLDDLAHRVPLSVASAICTRTSRTSFRRTERSRLAPAWRTARAAGFAVSVCRPETPDSASAAGGACHSRAVWTCVRAPFRMRRPGDPLAADVCAAADPFAARRTVGSGLAGALDTAWAGLQSPHIVAKGRGGRIPAGLLASPARGFKMDCRPGGTEGR